MKFGFRLGHKKVTKPSYVVVNIEPDLAAEAEIIPSAAEPVNMNEIISGKEKKSESHLHMLSPFGRIGKPTRTFS